MNEKTFKKFMEAASQDAQKNMMFSEGYKIGLRRFYHGSALEVSECLSDCPDDKSQGYILGIEGKPYPTLHGLTGGAGNNLRGDKPMVKKVLAAPEESWSEWNDAAERSSLSRSEWMRRVLDEAVRS